MRAAALFAGIVGITAAAWLLLALAVYGAYLIAGVML